MLSNSYSSTNLGIPSSIILNNYSIQNLIITPKYSHPYYQPPITSYDNYKRISNQISYSPPPRKSPRKNFNSIYFNEINLSETNPLLNSKSSNKNTDELRISSPPLLYKGKNPSKIFPISKIYSLERENKNEKHPQDSVSKNKVKKPLKNVLINNNNINRIKKERNRVILKTSISQKHFGVGGNIISNEDNKNKGKDIPIPRNNSSKKKKFQLTKIIYLEPKDLGNLKEFLFGEQIGKGTFGKIFSAANGSCLSRDRARF